MRTTTALCLLGLLIATPALGQSELSREELDAFEAQQQTRRAQFEATEAGRGPTSSVGRAGERQTREQAAPNIKPTGRISNRINNRVQSRIRNRIDRNYDPQANARSPFEVAEEEARNNRRR